MINGSNQIDLAAIHHKKMSTPKIDSHQHFWHYDPVVLFPNIGK